MSMLYHLKKIKILKIRSCDAYVMLINYINRLIAVGEIAPKPTSQMLKKQNKT